MSVMTPFDVPFSMTVAPIMGSPSGSTTLPLISCCACIVMATISVRKLRISLFAFFICIVVNWLVLFY